MNDENEPLVLKKLEPQEETQNTDSRACGNSNKSKTEQEEIHFKSADEQIQHFEKRIKICAKKKDKVGENDALSRLGIIYYKLRLFQEAKSCQERHLALTKLLKDERGQKRACCNLGCCLRRLGEFDRAIECYEEGLAIARELNDKRSESKFLNNLGNLYEQMTDFDQAIAHHLSRLKLALEIKDSDAESKAYASLGNLYHIMGNIRASIKYYERLVVCLKIKLAVQEKSGVLIPHKSQNSLPPVEEEGMVEEEAAAAAAFNDDMILMDSGGSTSNLQETPTDETNVDSPLHQSSSPQHQPMDPVFASMIAECEGRRYSERSLAS